MNPGKRRRQASSLLQVVVPIKTLLYQLSFLLMVAAAVALILLARADSPALQKARTRVMDVVTPALAVLSSPTQAWNGLKVSVSGYFAVHEDNAQLRRENERLQRLQGVAVELEAENRRLREQVRFLPEPSVSFVTARVVGTAGGPYMRSVIINSGASQGIREGQVVISRAGLVGRIHEVGEYSARIMLITDLNSRVPVMAETSRERAIMAGSDSGLPTLLYLPEDSKVAVGEKIVTSGDGEFFPAGIQAGIVQEIRDGQMKVRPLVDWSRLEYVNIVHYQAAQGQNADNHDTRHGRDVNGQDTHSRNQHGVPKR